MARTVDWYRQNTAWVDRVRSGEYLSYYARNYENRQDELRTVIINLLDNAVKYSPEAVRVSVSVAAPAPQTVWVRVQDRGVGIPKKQLKRIFNRFYRVQARGLKNVKGTGLGLYIVRSIARAHGGRVFAQSEGEGRGSTFTLELPRLAS